MSHTDKPADLDLSFTPSAKWKSAEAYAMRRILTLRDDDGKRIGFRPMIQQGKGENRKTHSEVFRVTDQINESVAMAMAQRWRDHKERELGIGAGKISKKSASRFTSHISIVVSNKPPHRSCWRWAPPNRPSITKYFGQRRGYNESYLELVAKICEATGADIPEDLQIPIPSDVQYAILITKGVKDLPDRRKNRADSSSKQL